MFTSFSVAVVLVAEVREKISVLILIVNEKPKNFNLIDDYNYVILNQFDLREKKKNKEQFENLPGKCFELYLGF